MLKLFWRLVKAARSFAARLWRLPNEAAATLGGSQGDSRRLLLSLAIILPIALLAALVLPKVALVMTPSIDARVVWAAPGPIAKGDLVMFTLSHPVAGPKPVSVTKYALCLPGDRLGMIETPSRTSSHDWDGHYFCNDEPLGVSLPYATNGLKLSHFQWHGVIPAGLAYVGSHHPRGLDSRYFGLIPIARLTRMARVL